MDAAQGSGGLIQVILLYAAIIAVFYFILVRPQKKKEKAMAQMRTNLKKGDTIVTMGGIIGKVVQIKDDSIKIEVSSDKTRITIEKWAVQEVKKQSTEKEEPAEEVLESTEETEKTEE